MYAHDKFDKIRQDFVIGIYEEQKGFWLVDNYSDYPRHLRIRFVNPTKYALVNDFIIITDENRFMIIEIEIEDGEDYVLKNYHLKNSKKFNDRIKKLGINEELEFVEINWDDY